MGSLLDGQTVVKALKGERTMTKVKLSDEQDKRYGQLFAIAMNTEEVTELEADAEAWQGLCEEWPGLIPVSWMRCDFAEEDFGLASVRILPPVFCPRGGTVTIEATGETAIVRVFDANFEQIESRMQCALVKVGEELQIISASEQS